MARAGIGTKGIAKLRAKLQKMEKKDAKKANRAAMRTATLQLAKAVRKDITTVDSGVYKKAIIGKVETRGLWAFGRIGADVAVLKADPEKRPSNIDWLNEFGHVSSFGTFVPPSGDIRRSEAANLPAANETYARRLAEEINKYW